MAQMIDSIDVTRANIYKGAARLLIADPDVVTSFPGRLESVMNPREPIGGGTAYELVSGWSDLGPTTEDGLKVRREADSSEGIPLDQRTTNLDEGEPENWKMFAEAELLETTLVNINIAWEAGTLRSHIADGSHVAQDILDLDAPLTFTERMAAFVQEDPDTNGLRFFIFRKAIPQVDGSEMTLQSKEASGLPTKFLLKADETVSSGSGQFGRVYVET